MASPASFGRASRIKVLVLELAVGATGAITLAYSKWPRMLSQLGFIALPADDRRARLQRRPSVVGRSQDAVARVPAATEAPGQHSAGWRSCSGLSRHPSTRTVACGRAATMRPRNRSASEAQILRAALDFDREVSEMGSQALAVSRMRTRASNYDAEVTGALLKLTSAERALEPAAAHHRRPRARYGVRRRRPVDLWRAAGAPGLEVTPSIIEGLRLLGPNAVREARPDMRTGHSRRAG